MLLGRWRPGLLSANCMWWKPQLIQDKLSHWESTPQQQSFWRCARQCHVHKPSKAGKQTQQGGGGPLLSNSIQRRNQFLVHETSGNHLDIPLTFNVMKAQWLGKVCGRCWINVCLEHGWVNIEKERKSPQFSEDVYIGVSALYLWERRC